MAKSRRQSEPVSVEQQIDRFARVLQILSLLSAVALAVIDFLTPNQEFPVWLVPGLFGMAAGFSPKDMKEVIVAFFTGRKR